MRILKLSTCSISASAQTDTSQEEEEEPRTDTCRLPWRSGQKCQRASNHSNGTYTFTNAGATGREGPNQAQVNASYSGTNLAGSVTINTQGIQEWTVPASGTYRIEAWGAKGGNGTDPYAGGIGQNSPGKGAYLAGSFALTSGELIKILVGQVGESASGDGGGGGGGGTFVIKGSTTPLVVAGGGGGGGDAPINMV